MGNAGQPRPRVTRVRRARKRRACVRAASIVAEKRAKMRLFLPPNGGKTAQDLGAGACAGHARGCVRGMPTAFQTLPSVGKVFTFPAGDRRPPFMREIFPTGFLQKRPGGLGGSRSLGCPRKGRERE